MMGKNKNSETAGAADAKIGTLIGTGAVFDGNLSAPETVRIDGTLNGDCSCEGNLILGRDGTIKGNITAKNVTISGKVTGDVVAEGKLEMFSTARVTGDITAKSLIIDEDACFDGRCSMSAESGIAAEQNHE